VPAAVMVAVMAGGCGGQDDAAEGLRPTVTDSAGVEIVVNRVPPTGLPVYATLDTARNLDLGFVLGDPTSRLLDVKGVATLTNGEVAVADGRTSEIRYYGPDGAWLRSTGGKGFDDGEFMELSRMGRARGDTLWVMDDVRDRLTVLEREAGVLRVTQLPAGYSAVGRFGGGAFLLAPRWSASLHESDPKEGVRRDSAHYLQYWPESGDTAGAGVFPHDEIVVLETDWGAVPALPPFGRRTVRAVGPGGFYVADEEDFIIGGYNPDGTLRQSIRLEGLDLSLSLEQVAQARASRAATPAERVDADRFWAAAPDTRPAHGPMLLDAGGNLWVAEYAAGAEPPRTWMVFGGDGAIRGTVTVPRYFVPQEIGVRYIVGVMPTVGGDQRVVRYLLNR